MMTAVDGSINDSIEGGHNNFICLDTVLLGTHESESEGEVDYWYCAKGIDLKQRTGVRFLLDDQQKARFLNPQNFDGEKVEIEKWIGDCDLQ